MAIHLITFTFVIYKFFEKEIISILKLRRYGSVIEKKSHSLWVSLKTKIWSLVK